MSVTNAVARTVDDYSNLRTLPAMLSVAFVGSSLYMFNGLAELTFLWADYTLTDQHAMVVSLVVGFVAFMSSETNDFEKYAGWEQAIMVLGIVAIVAIPMSGTVASLVFGFGLAGEVGAFLLSIAAWGVAIVR